jgi:hypothetical protein
VSHRSVCDGKFTEVVANHLRLDLDLVEHLSVVDGELRADHLGQNKHVSKVGLDGFGSVERTASCNGYEILARVIKKMV